MATHECVNCPGRTDHSTADCPMAASRCSCPSGDGSLCWPCAVHPPGHRQVTRYGLQIHRRPYGLEPVSAGCWVRYEDHASLVADCERLQRVEADSRIALRQSNALVRELEAELRALKAQQAEQKRAPVATVVLDKSGDWYIDALQPSRFGERGYLEDGMELFNGPPLQHVSKAMAIARDALEGLEAARGSKAVAEKPGTAE